MILHRSQHLDLGLFPHREIHHYKAEGQRGVCYIFNLRSLEVNLSFVNLSSDKKTALLKHPPSFLGFLNKSRYCCIHGLDFLSCLEIASGEAVDQGKSWSI